MSIDPKNLAGTAHVTFNEDFNNLSLWNGSSGRWATSFWYQDPKGNGGSLPSNGEQEWYINSQYAPTSGVRPWTTNNGVLTITASPTPASIKSQVNNYSYVSGELNTYHSFSQTYGYFEMRAQLPKGQGFWPAFWLMPENGNWPPELDIMEVLGQSPGTLVNTVHSNSVGMISHNTSVPDTSAGYHTYGVDWEPDHVTWYFDGEKVFQTSTPSDMKTPMYIIANLAAGGNWPGPTDGHSSAQLHVDYIRAYASGATASGGSTGNSVGGSAPSQPSTPPSSPANNGHTFTSDNKGDHWTGTGANDTFNLGRGGDVVTGGGGADLFKFAEAPWAGGHITDFTPGADKLDLTAMLSRYHYTGSNPVADGRLKLAADGHGDTQVWFNADGLSNASGVWLVTTLDHVAPTSVHVSGGWITG